MVRKLLKLTLPNLMVLQKNSHHNTKNLKRATSFSDDSKNNSVGQIEIFERKPLGTLIFHSISCFNDQHFQVPS